jgi:hypothetical protein
MQGRPIGGISFGLISFGQIGSDGFDLIGSAFVGQFSSEAGGQ